MNSLICKFCQKACKNTNSQRNHERLCKENPNKQFSKFRELDFQKNKPGAKNQYLKAAALNLPKPIVNNVTRQKLSVAMKSRSKEFNLALAKKISKTVNDKVASGTWHTSLAKNLHYDYNGIDLHGAWELQYAQFLDKNFIQWERNQQIFSYQFEGKIRKYKPDFYLVDTQEFIKIKGYKTEKDQAKWNDFPNDLKLKVLFWQDLVSLGVIS